MSLFHDILRPALFRLLLAPDRVPRLRSATTCHHSRAPPGYENINYINAITAVTGFRGVATFIKNRENTNTPFPYK
jgi:hypothetical protein